MAMTPREVYNQMMNGEEVKGKMSTVHSMFAKEILRRQAGELAKEKCVVKIAFTADNVEPWVAEILFINGELSEDAQRTLSNMQKNAHRVEMVEWDAATKLMFYVYTVEADAE